MQLTCKCLNVVIDSKSEAIEEGGNHLDDGTPNHPFFNEVETVKILALVVVLR